MLRKISVDINDKDYIDFLLVYMQDHASTKEKRRNIIKCHVISYRIVSYQIQVEKSKTNVKKDF